MANQAKYQRIYMGKKFRLSPDSYIISFFWEDNGVPHLKHQKEERGNNWAYAKMSLRGYRESGTQVTHIHPY